MAKRRRKLTGAEARAIFDQEAADFQRVHEAWLRTPEGNKARLAVNLARTADATNKAVTEYRRSFSAYSAAHFARKLERNPLGKRKAREMLRRGEYSSPKQRRFLGARASGRPVRRNGPREIMAATWKVYEIRDAASGGKRLGYVVAQSEPAAHTEITRRFGTMSRGLEVGELVAMLPTRKHAVEYAGALRVQLMRTRRARR